MIQVKYEYTSRFIFIYKKKKRRKKICSTQSGITTTANKRQHIEIKIIFIIIIKMKSKERTCIVRSGRALAISFFLCLWLFCTYPRVTAIIPIRQFFFLICNVWGLCVLSETKAEQRGAAAHYTDDTFFFVPTLNDGKTVTHKRAIWKSNRQTANDDYAAFWMYL